MSSDQAGQIFALQNEVQQLRARLEEAAQLLIAERNHRLHVQQQYFEALGMLEKYVERFPMLYRRIH